MQKESIYISNQVDNRRASETQSIFLGELIRAIIAAPCPSVPTLSSVVEQFTWN